jgi:hypothetical protein
VSHAAVYLIGVLSNKFQGLIGSVLLGVGHGFVSSGLFTCVGGVLYDRSGTRSISLYKGLTQLMPLFVILFFILCLGNCGAPLTLNFVGEFLSLFGVFERLPYLGLLAGISIVFSAAYTIYLFNRTAFGGVFSKFFAENISDISLRETNILLLLVLFTVILGIYPSIITDGLNYTLSTLIYEVGASSVDNHDVYISMIPAAPSLALAQRDLGGPISHLLSKIKEDPEIVPDLFEMSLNVAGSIMSTTVVLAGVTIPVSVVPVVLIASSLFAFRMARKLERKVNALEQGRKDLVELGTDNPTLDNPNPSQEEIRQLLQAQKDITDRMPLDESVMDTSMILQDTLETIHEYFGRAIDHVSPEEVNAIIRAGIEIRQAIPEFLSSLHSSVNCMTVNFLTTSRLIDFTN